MSLKRRVPMKSVQKQSKKVISWGVFTFLMGIGLVFNTNPAKAETINFSHSYLGTFEGSTTFATSSHTGIQPGLSIETKSPYGSGSYYETRSGSLTLKDTREGATIKNAALKGQTLVNLAKNKSCNSKNAVCEINIPVKPNTKYIVFGAYSVDPSFTHGALILSSSVYVESANGYNGDSLYTATVTNGRGTEYRKRSADLSEPLIFTTKSTERYLHLRSGNSGTSYLLYDNMMIFEYQEGMENWDISYFEGMRSVQAPSLTITGKNLVNPDEVKNYDIIDETGKEYPNPLVFNTGFIPIEKDKNYTARFYSEGETDGYIYLYYYDVNKVYLGNTKTSDAKYLRAKRIVSREGIALDEVKFQIEEGSIATPYEPYQVNTLKFKESITLRSKGEVYDEIDLMTGKLTQRIGEKNEILAEPIVRWVKILSSPIFGQIKQADLSIKGEILPTIVSVTVPTAPLSFVLNPNEEPERQFVASEFSLTNESQIPITIELKEFTQLTDTMEDVLPDHFEDWGDLSLSESRSMALGLVPQESESWLWCQPGPYYVADTGSKVIGRVKRKSTVDFKFTALHGQAFGHNLNPQYRLTFIFDF